MSLSLLAIPVFLDTATQPAQLYQEWARMYHYGHRVLPGMALGTSALYAYTAIRKRSSKQKWTMTALTAVITLMMIPFTLLVMVPVNNELFRMAADAQTSTDGFGTFEQAIGLIQRWSILHIIRSCFPLAGAAMGSMSTMHRS